MPWLTDNEAIDGALKTRYIELSDDSKEKPPPIPSPPPKDALTAKAYLEPGQIQDLADQITELTKAAAGHDLKYQVQIEFKGDENKIEAAKKINDLLKEVSEKLQLLDHQ